MTSKEQQENNLESPADSSSPPQEAEEGRALNQDEIDNLLGFSAQQQDSNQSGIKALLDRSLLAYERLPMLEVVFDRFVRMASTTLRNFTSDNVDIDIHSITSIRFGDYINSIPMPALLTLFKAIEWDGFGIVTMDGPLVYSMVDVLFGGRRSTIPIRIEGRPYTTIEQSIVQYIAETMLTDMGAAFDPLSPATFKFERLESNPRFATIARPADAAILLKLRVDMDERGGNIEILLPYVTIEPIRNLLTQVFMGEKFGKDSVWETHFGNEVINTSIKLEAMLGKKKIPMRHMMNLQIGDTIMLDTTAKDDINLKCKGVELMSGKLGKSEDKVAIQINDIINAKLKEIL